jgi:hypothetical protein
VDREEIHGDKDSVNSCKFVTQLITWRHTDRGGGEAQSAGLNNTHLLSDTQSSIQEYAHNITYTRSEKAEPAHLERNLSAVEVRLLTFR